MSDSQRRRSWLLWARDLEGMAPADTAVVMERDGTIAGKYRKMHIPDDPAYYEKFYFTPGGVSRW